MNFLDFLITCTDGALQHFRFILGVLAPDPAVSVEDHFQLFAKIFRCRAERDLKVNVIMERQREGQFHLLRCFAFCLDFFAADLQFFS